MLTMFGQDIIIYCHIDVNSLRTADASPRSPLLRDVLRGGTSATHDVKCRSLILQNSDHPAYLFKGSSKAFEINLLSKFLCPWNIRVILMFINFFFFFSDGLESKTSSSQIFYSRKVGFLYIILLWNSRNREHQKYLWNVIVLWGNSQ